MKIGLVRHFTVNCPHKQLMSAKEFREWVHLYDHSPIRMTDGVMSENRWETCYCSDLSRAIETAHRIHSGTIIESAFIREVPVAPIFESRIKLPYVFWMAMGRAAWYFSHKSQPETLKQTEGRVEKFISGIIAKPEETVLIVTHGFLMRQIQKELASKGFFGDSFKRAINGKIYMFENNKI